MDIKFVSGSSLLDGVLGTLLQILSAAISLGRRAPESRSLIADQEPETATAFHQQSSCRSSQRTGKMRHATKQNYLQPLRRQGRQRHSRELWARGFEDPNPTEGNRAALLFGLRQSRSGHLRSRRGNNGVGGGAEFQPCAARRQRSAFLAQISCPERRLINWRKGVHYINRRNVAEPYNRVEVSGLIFGSPRQL